MSNDCAIVELYVVLVPDGGNTAGLPHSALIKLSTGSEFETIMYKIKNEISVTAWGTEKAEYH